MLALLILKGGDDFLSATMITELSNQELRLSRSSGGLIAEWPAELLSTESFFL